MQTYDSTTNSVSVLQVHSLSDPTKEMSKENIHGQTTDHVKCRSIISVALFTDLNPSTEWISQFSKQVSTGNLDNQLGSNSYHGLQTTQQLFFQSQLTFISRAQEPQEAAHITHLNTHNT